MADIVAFPGIRYDGARVGDMSRVLAPPYDVIGEAERAELEARHPQNVVRIELPRGEGDARYTEAAHLLGAWKAEGILRADASPAFYVYEQQFTLPQAPGRIFTRRGFFAAVRLEPFERRVVLPHEKTLAGPKEDRLKLMRATRTQISPIFGLFRDADGGAREIIDAAAALVPALDATTADRVRHRTVAPGGSGRHLGPGAHPGRQADPDRRRPPPLRDDAGARSPSCGRSTSRRVARRPTSR